MDNTTLYEQVVRRERTPKYGLTVALIILGVIGVPAIIFTISIVAKIPYLNIVALFIFVLAIYFGWYLITSLNVEYEYAFLSSTLRVDKVIAKRGRKKVVKLDVKRLDGSPTATTSPPSMMRRRASARRYSRQTKHFSRA